jgi:hypothetical protein
MKKKKTEKKKPISGACSGCHTYLFPPWPEFNFFFFFFFFFFEIREETGYYAPPPKGQGKRREETETEEFKNKKYKKERGKNHGNLISRSRKVCHPAPRRRSRPETRLGRGRQHSRMAIRRRVAKATFKVEPQHLGRRCGRRGSGKCDQSNRVNSKKHEFFLFVIFEAAW